MSEGAVSAEDFAYVRQLMYEAAGLVLDPDKAYLVETRLQKLLRANQTDVAGLVARLRAGGDSWLRTAVVEAMAIQETYFFRDPWLFDSLREEVLPGLIKARQSSRQLRIWCGATSTGQEIYSLCLMLREEFPQLMDWDLQIYASDFSLVALERAQAGRYSMPEVNRGLPARLLMKYFTQVGLEWELHREVRRMVTFLPINLVREWPELPVFDVVLLRNVLIYFDEGTRRDVLARVRGLMQDDACLFLGATESPLGLMTDFRSNAARGGTYYRIVGRGNSR